MAHHNRNPKRQRGQRVRASAADASWPVAFGLHSTWPRRATPLRTFVFKRGVPRLEIACFSELFRSDAIDSVAPRRLDNQEACQNTAFSRQKMLNGVARRGLPRREPICLIALAAGDPPLATRADTTPAGLDVGDSLFYTDLRDWTPKGVCRPVACHGFRPVFLGRLVWFACRIDVSH